MNQKARAVNVCNKTRDKRNPYVTWRDTRTGWKYSLLKSWQGDSNKLHARWMVYVEGDFNEIGDTYVADMRPGFVHALDVTVDETVFATWSAFLQWTVGE